MLAMRADVGYWRIEKNYRGHSPVTPDLVGVPDLLRVSGASAPLLPFTLLDGHLDANSIFSHPLPAGKSAWLYVIEGEVEMIFNGQSQRLSASKAFALHN